MPTDAGKGEHHYYLIKRPAENPNDTAEIEARKHYLGIDAVRWFVNKQGTILTNRIASGTVHVSLANETYDAGLGLYQLEGGARTAPIFDRPVLPNRIYPGDKITLRIYMRAIQQDTLLGGLLREMSKATLDVIAGAVGAATATGPMAVLLAAGASLTGGVREILNQGKRGLTILDPEGIEVTLSASDLRGPETYLLVHRGLNLAANQLRLAITGNNISDVLYADAPLEDGAWCLFRLRREDEFGGPRPWEQEARSARAELDALMTQWSLDGVTVQEVREQLKPKGSQPPSLGDRILTVIQSIRTDWVLAEREAIAHTGKLKARLDLAQQAARTDNVQHYFDQRDELETKLKDGQRPPRTAAKALSGEAEQVHGTRPLIDANTPALEGEELWRTLRYVGNA